MLMMGHPRLADPRPRQSINPRLLLLLCGLLAPLALPLSRCVLTSPYRVLELISRVISVRDSGR